jgi:hypothetical protein
MRLIIEFDGDAARRIVQEAAEADEDVEEYLRTAAALRQETDIPPETRELVADRWGRALTGGADEEGL